MLRGASAVLALVMVLPGAAAARWHPASRLSWYWQLQGNLDYSRPVTVYDIDGFSTSASEVGALHAAGKRVVCYIDAGSWENYRPDARKFPPRGHRPRLRRLPR